MLHRAAILAASLTATLTLVAGLVLAGVATGGGPANAGPVAPAAATLPIPTPRVQVDTVYVAPPARPVEVTVSKVVTTTGSADDDGEHGSDD